MLKKSTSGVRASFSPSTYIRGYASALHSLRPSRTAFLILLREQGSPELQTSAYELAENTHRHVDMKKGTA